MAKHVHETWLVTQRRASQNSNPILQLRGAAWENNNNNYNSDKTDTSSRRLVSELIFLLI